ncbi:GCD1 Nucleoside-diphosphate-sugar pyrophosphorylase involved in lipopolysaccharide biosynthesis/translation initiation factor 2B, gamma/epsilon subunits (eIF-2Bgamma/eIF-2Bepsilon) [Candidatus Nanopelagicaceae bacterium]
MKINLVIPAAGMGSRFRANGVDTPKPLIPILGVPMIGWVIANFALNPQDEIWIITRKEDGIPLKLETLLPGLKNEIHFIEIDKLTDGAATTLQFALNKISTTETVLCANSDQFVSSSLDPFMKLVRSNESDGQILTMAAHGNKWSYVKRDEFNEVIDVVEKVQVSDEATVGVYGWRTARDAISSIEKMKEADFKVNGEFYVAPSYTFLINQGGRVATHNVGSVEMDVHGLGTPEDLNLFLRNPNLDKYFADVRKRLGFSE